MKTLIILIVATGILTVGGYYIHRMNQEIVDLQIKDNDLNTRLLTIEKSHGINTDY